MKNLARKSLVAIGLMMSLSTLANDGTSIIKEKENKVKEMKAKERKGKEKKQRKVK